MAVEAARPLPGMLKQLRALLEPLRKEEPPPPRAAVGFFTDTSLCIGCKACEIACKQWNQLPAREPAWAGTSYDNTRELNAINWRHVLFIERLERHEESSSDGGPTGGTGLAPTELPFFNPDRWLMLSDVCKHCANAPCLEACPTGAIVRTEFDTVYVQQDICNGCGYCVVACPFGVIARDALGGTARKCTLCYDRLKDGLEPACAKVCPTDSIVFGPVDQLRQQAQARLAQLHERGLREARLYGADQTILEGGLHAFFLLLDEPAVYNLPEHPSRPSKHVLPASLWTVLAALILGLLGIFSFRRR